MFPAAVVRKTLLVTRQTPTIPLVAFGETFPHRSRRCRKLSLFFRLSTRRDEPPTGALHTADRFFNVPPDLVTVVCTMAVLQLSEARIANGLALFSHPTASCPTAIVSTGTAAFSTSPFRQGKPFSTRTCCCLIGMSTQIRSMAIRPPLMSDFWSSLGFRIRWQGFCAVSECKI